MPFVSLKVLFFLGLYAASLFYLFVAASWALAHISERMPWRRPAFPRNVPDEVWNEFRSRRWWEGLSWADLAATALSLCWLTRLF
ncbi:MAG: hypothetical protein Q7S86_05460 [bacterium]|nr:hypothetical protein [bacterium]